MIELQPGRGMRQQTSGEGSLESIAGKGIVAEPLGMRAHEDVSASDSASSTSTTSSGAVSVSDPLLSGGTHSKRMDLVEIPLDDDEPGSRNSQSTDG